MTNQIDTSNPETGIVVNPAPTNSLAALMSAAKATDSVNSLAALMKSVTLFDANGSSLEVDAESLAAMIPGGSHTSELVYRLVAGQPRERAGKEFSNQLYLTRKVKNPTSGKWEPDNSEPLGTSIQGHIVGYTLRRAMFESYDESAVASGSAGPICRSESFTVPDPRYAGKFSMTCCAQNGKYINPVCPMAAWGPKNPQTGKSTPPRCQEHWVVYLAVAYQGQMVLAEAVLKSKGAPSGKAIIQGLIPELKNKGLPVYAWPITVSMIEAGVGNAYVAERVNVEAVREIIGGLTEDDITSLSDAEIKIKEYIKAQLERAQFIPEIDKDLNPVQPHAPIATGNPVQPQAPAVSYVTHADVTPANPAPVNTANPATPKRVARI